MAGEIYLLHVNKIFVEIENAKNAVNSTEIQPHGRLIIGIAGVFYSQFFIKRFQKFLQKFPKIQLQTPEENAPTDLLNGLADLVITKIDIKDNQLIKEYLFAIHRSIYATSGYIKKYGMPAKLLPVLQKQPMLILGVGLKNYKM